MQCSESISQFPQRSIPKISIIVSSFLILQMIIIIEKKRNRKLYRCKIEIGTSFCNPRSRSRSNVEVDKGQSERALNPSASILQDEARFSVRPQLMGFRVSMRHRRRWTSTSVKGGRTASPVVVFTRRASNLQSVIQPYMAGTIGGLAIRQIIPYIIPFFAGPSIYVHAHNINY